MIKKIMAVLFLLAVAAVAWAGQVQAQSEIRLAAVTVNLWPEYDRPDMLVMYDLTLPEEITLPAEVRVRIPASSGGAHAVAERQASGEMFNLVYVEQTEGDWITVVITATSPNIHLEYYDPGLQKDGTQRRFNFRWPGDHPIDTFLILVQQPVGAGDIQIRPSLGTRAPSDGGLVYYRIDWGALPAGQPVEISLEYQKPDDTLTSQSLPVVPSEPIDEGAGGPLATGGALALLGTLGLLLIFGGVYWYWRSGREKAVPVARRARGGRGGRVSSFPAGEPSKDAVPAAAENQHIYCHQCGKRAAAGDRFCRTCGTQLRTG